MMNATAISPLTGSRDGPDTIGFRSSGPSPTLHLVGPGRVGRSFLRLLPGTGYRLIGVSDSGATVYDRGGLDPAALAAWKSGGRGLGDLAGAERVSARCAVALVGADLVVDATATDDRGTPDSLARGRQALRAGSRLVLAAKNGLRVAAGEWLLGPERDKIGCNAVLGDTGLQLRRELAELRAHCEEVALVANVSSTAILSEVERGASLEEGLGRARELGFLEADPTRDLDGSDAAEKLCIVATALWGGPWGIEGARTFPISSVERQDLRDLDAEWVRRSFERGATTRLVARARREGPLRVALEEVHAGSPLAAPADRVVYAYRLKSRLRVHVGSGVGHERTARALLRDVAALEVVR